MMIASEGVAEGTGRGPPLTPTSTHTQPSPRPSPATTGIRSYLQPVTALDTASLDTLKSLLRVTLEVRRSTSQVRRIQRGSPGAGSLGETLAGLRPRVNKISSELSEVFTTYNKFPGMYLVSTQFLAFCEVLNENFNDGGNDPGYSDRVHLLEKMMYIAGTLRGHVEMVLEQHEYWKAKLAGREPSRLARRLNFNDAIDPAQTVPGDEVFAQQPNLQELFPQAQGEQTFKVSVSLPEEVHTGLAQLWEEQKFTDIEFVVNGQRVPAHKTVLAAQSQYFECMLYGNMKEASMSEITLKDVPVSAFRKVLQFAYTGTLNMDKVTMQDILEVTSVADRFGFVPLKEALGDQLSQNHVSLGTVLALFVHSDVYHLQQLHNSCLQFIESHTNQVLQHHSLLSLPKESLIAIISRDTFVVPEIEIFKAVQKWKEHNVKSIEEISKLLECIRLSEFSSSEEIFAEVEPAGLLDDKTILAGVRVMCKPCVTEMNPRGRKERNKNLFTSPIVMFDPSTPTLYQPLQPALGFVYQTPPQQCVADAVIQLGASTYISHGLGGSKPHTCSSMIVALGDLYIINYLNLKGYPSVSDEEQLQGKCYSYVVSVSKDKQTWLKLFDYSSYVCRGAQHLLFPRQAARYVHMELKWREDASKPLPLQFLACCLVDESRPFSFLPNGIIAPQYEHDVVTVPCNTLDGNNKLCVAYFRQPYSTAYIRFTLECLDKDVSSVDITVSVGLLECDSSGSGGGGGLGSGQFGTGGQGVNSGHSQVIGGGGLQLGGGVHSGGGLQLGGGVHSGGGLQLGGGVHSGGGLQLGGGVHSGGGLPLGREVPSSVKGNCPSTRAHSDCSSKHLQKKLKLKDMDRVLLNSPITVRLKEMTISYVAATIRVVHRKSVTVTSPPATSGETGPAGAGVVVMPVMKTDAPHSRGLGISQQITEPAIAWGSSQPTNFTSNISPTSTTLVKPSTAHNVPLCTNTTSANLSAPTLPNVGPGTTTLGMFSLPTLQPATNLLSASNISTQLALQPATQRSGVMVAPAVNEQAVYGMVQLQLISGVLPSTDSGYPAQGAPILNPPKFHTRKPKGITTRSPAAPIAGALQRLAQFSPSPTHSPLFKIINVVCKSSIE